MRDKGMAREAVEMLAKLGLKVNEEDLAQDFNDYNNKNTNTNTTQGMRQGTSHKVEENAKGENFRTYDNPLYHTHSQGMNNFVHVSNNIPYEHKYNHFNNFSYQDQFAPHNRFHSFTHPYNNTHQSYWNYFQGGFGLVNTEHIRQFYFSRIMTCPHPIPNEVRTLISKFTGRNAITREAHCKAFDIVMEDLCLPYEDVKMKLFMQSLVEDARDWFIILPNASISSLVEFKRLFLEQYGDQNSPEFALHKIISIKKEKMK